MTNSKLITATKLSPNHSGQRTQPISRITPHCVVGHLSAEATAGLFTSPARQASCNYAIGDNHDICLVVDEANRSWCSSSAANDQRAVTIEVASDVNHPYAFSANAYEDLVKLCADICRRNGKTRVTWIPDRAQALAYSPAADEMQFTVHRWFANKSCPGDWLMERMQDLTDRVNALLAPSKLYRVQVGAFRNKKNAEAYAEKIKAAGFDAFIVEV